MNIKQKTTKEKILKLLSYGQLTQKDLARKLKLSEPTISYHIKTLANEKKVDAVRGISKYLTLSNPSLKPSKSQTHKVSKSHTINDNTVKSSQVDSSLAATAIDETYRYHAPWVEAPLEPYEPKELESKLRKLGIKNIDWALQNNYPIYIPNYKNSGFGIRLHSYTMMIIHPDLEQAQAHSLPFALEQGILKGAHNIALELESLLGLKIRRTNDILALYMTREENAQTNNPSAKDLIHRNYKINITHPNTPHVCFSIDESPTDGLPGAEAEAKMPDNNLDHTVKTKRLYDDVLHHNAWDKITKDHELLRSILESQNRTTQQVERLSQEINLHTPVFEAITLSAKASAERDKAFLEVLQSFAPTKTRKLRDVLDQKQGKLNI